MSNQSENTMNRRTFLNKAAVGSLVGAGAMAFLGILQLPLPKVFNEPPSIFKIGSPDDFPVDTYQLIAGKNVFVFRDRAGVRALSAICTHLGCVVTQTTDGFQCPCHGSRFSPNGDVESGPAPKALDWLKVNMAPDGYLTVDMDKKVGIDDVFIV
ncbi:MAG: ubiquinol-cytochrome c reductase iron-sulfur subunit [bacterium]|nr:ubiquinol-cytochrome c reductase iron-sulfur subunit [bacterium]